MREIPPRPGKNSDHAVLQVAIQSRIKGVLATGCITQESRKRSNCGSQVNQQGEPTDTENPTAYYLTIAYLGQK